MNCSIIIFLVHFCIHSSDKRLLSNNHRLIHSWMESYFGLF